MEKRGEVREGETPELGEAGAGRPKEASGAPPRRRVDELADQGLIARAAAVAGGRLRPDA